MRTQLYTPDPALQEFVASISIIDAELPHGIEQVVTPYPPTPHQSIIFYGRDNIRMKKDGMNDFEHQASTMLIGPQYTMVNLMVVKRLKAVRVDFHPGGLFRLLGIPMTHFFDGGFNAVDVFGNKMNQVNQQLQDEKDIELRKLIVENFLLQQRNCLKSILPFDFAIRELLKDDGNTPIDKIASLACLSLRQFERKCNERIGISPKAFARISRFSKAYRLKEASPGLTWTAIAYKAGYFDQMHFIRDFKEFAGVTPSIIEGVLSGTPFRMQARLNF